MPADNSKFSTSNAESPGQSEKPKPCCSCPDTRKARDDCMMETGDEERCKQFIEAHRECMRKLGFNV